MPLVEEVRVRPLGTCDLTEERAQETGSLYSVWLTGGFSSEMSLNRTSLDALES